MHRVFSSLIQRGWINLRVGSSGFVRWDSLPWPLRGLSFLFFGWKKSLGCFFSSLRRSLRARRLIKMWFLVRLLNLKTDRSVYFHFSLKLLNLMLQLVNCFEQRCYLIILFLQFSFLICQSCCNSGYLLFLRTYISVSRLGYKSFSLFYCLHVVSWRNDLLLLVPRRRWLPMACNSILLLLLMHLLIKQLYLNFMKYNPQSP